MSTTRHDWGAWRSSILAKVNPRRTAIAVIDLQNDFCSKDGALAALGSDVSPSEMAAEAIVKFLPSVRHSIAMTAFFRLEYEPSRMSEVQRERLLRNGRPIICAPASLGAELFVNPEPGDRIFTKYRYSAFSNEEFRELLRSQSIETVAVAGVDTHICVESTVRQGYDLGYRMLVLSDLVATRRSEFGRHENSLAVCERYFGLVIESTTFLTTLNAATASTATTLLSP